MSNTTADRIWAQNEVSAARQALKGYEIALKRADLTEYESAWLRREIAHIRTVRLPHATAQMQAAGF